LVNNFAREGFAVPDFIEFIDSMDIMKAYRDEISKCTTTFNLKDKIIVRDETHFFTDPNMGSLSLPNCLENFGLVLTNHHNAIGDAKSLQLLCKEAAKAMGYKNYGDYVYCYQFFQLFHY